MFQTQTQTITKRRIEIYFLISTRFSLVSKCETTSLGSESELELSTFGERRKRWKIFQFVPISIFKLFSFTFASIRCIYITLVRQINPPEHSVQINFSILLLLRSFDCCLHGWRGGKGRNERINMDSSESSDGSKEEQGTFEHLFLVSIRLVWLFWCFSVLFPLASDFLAFFLSLLFLASYWEISQMKSMKNWKENLLRFHLFRVVSSLTMIWAEKGKIVI